MSNTNPTPNELLTALRDHNVDIKTYSGNGISWDTVGRAWNANGGGLYGAIVHHTAARVTGYSGVPSLNWCVTYADYPACNALVGRGKGETYLLSAGSAYHSGNGGPWPEIGINTAGNFAHFRTFGIEIEATVAYRNQITGAYIPESKPYITDYQVEQTSKICAALWDLCGWPSGDRIVTHGDWTDSGKYLNHSSYGPHIRRKNDTRRTTHSGKFWRKSAEKYKTSYTDNETPDSQEGTNSSSKDPDNVVNFARQIPRNAVAVSTVAGTPQTARFALLNLSNESIYISEGDTNVLTGSGEGLLWVKSRTIVEGDPYEISRDVDDKSSSGELIIETNWVQNDNVAESSLSLITSSFETRYRSIEVKIFGNPTVQLGDLVKFTYDINQITSDADEYYYVSKVSHNFEEGGLETTLLINPVIKSFGMV